MEAMEASAPTEAELRRVVDQLAIRDLLLRYARGIDRRDLDLVRSCYHDDAIDDHGSYHGDVDGFIAYLDRNPGNSERSMHFLGNQLIEVEGDMAHAESYCVAFFRQGATEDRRATDVYIWLRYIDRIDRRDGAWKIAHRVCAFEWSREDPVSGMWEFAPETTRGERSRGDVLYRTLAEFTARVPATQT
jgi:ketosteroid isomerase-like protein